MTSDERGLAQDHDVHGRRQEGGHEGPPRHGLRPGTASGDSAASRTSPVSFSIICILSGGINSLAQATSGAGGIGIGIGWLVGCFVSLVFAVAMAQISSAYPTAGGLYHWGSILGNRGTGWVTAWLNLLGLITVLGAINVGTWTFFIGTFGADARHREQHHHADDLPGHHHRRAGADQPPRHQADRASSPTSPAG